MWRLLFDISSPQFLSVSFRAWPLTAFWRYVSRSASAQLGFHKPQNEY
jgi:hypothetical protein